MRNDLSRLDDELVGAVVETLDCIHTFQTKPEYRKNAVAFAAPDQVLSAISSDAAFDRLGRADEDSGKIDENTDTIAKIVLAGLAALRNFDERPDDDDATIELLFEPATQYISHLMHAEKIAIKDKLVAMNSSAHSLLGPINE